MKTDLASKRRPGFTLVELLVVIAIIGVLTAILIPTLQIAIKKTREAAVKFELTQLAMAMEEYKQQSGLVYPPDFTDAVGPPTAEALLIAHLKKLSRNNNQNISNYLIADPDAMGPLVPIDKNADLTDGLDSNITPDEALVFWLGYTQKNAELPLPSYLASPPPLFPAIGNDNYRSFFAFDEGRLVDPDNDGFFSYIPKYGKKVPYVYFDSRTYGAVNTGGTATARYNPSAHGFTEASTTGWARPYIKSTGGFAEPNGFQIIAAGYDGDFGADLANKQFPTGVNFSLGDRDNFASFAEGRLDKDLDN